MCRVVSDPTHLCRMGVGLVLDVSGSVGSDTFVSDGCRIGVGCVGWCRIRHICVGLVSDWCRIRHFCVGLVSDWCQMGVGLVSDVSGGVGSDTFVSDGSRIGVGCVGKCRIRHICVGWVSDRCRIGVGCVGWCRLVSVSVG